MPSSSPVPFWMARLMLSAGMFTDLAFSTAVRRRGLELGSPPPIRAAIDISRMILVKTLPRLASRAPFLCLMDAHLECPDIGSLLQTAWRVRVYHPSGQQKSPDAGHRGFAGRIELGTRENPGNVLLSHQATLAVPSALEGLTAVFGMGTGVTPPP